MRRWRLLALLLIAAIPFGAQAAALPWPSLPQAERLQQDAIETLARLIGDPGTGDADRADAVDALVSARTPAAASALAALLTPPDSKAFVRRAIASGTGTPVYLGTPLVAALRRAALTDPEPAIRWAAGVSLVQITQAGDPLIRQLLGDPRTLAVAAIALQTQQAASAFPDRLHVMAEEALSRAFPDRQAFNVVERAAMLKALAQLGDRNAIPLLADTLADAQEESFVRASAAYSLGVLGAADSTDALMGALRSDDSVIAAAAAGALGKIQEQRTLDPLVSAMEDSSSLASLRAAAATALGAFGENAVVPLSVALLNDPDDSVRLAALTSLASIGGPIALGAATALAKSDYLKSCDPASCSSLLLALPEALAQLGAGDLAAMMLEQAFPALEGQLALLYAFAESSLVQLATAVGGAAPDFLRFLQNEPSLYTQALGLQALAALAGRQAREQLLPYANEGSPVLLRRVALEGLAPYATEADFPMLTAALGSPDRRTRNAGYAGLATLATAEVYPVLQAQLDSPTPSARIGSAAASLRVVAKWVAADRLLGRCNAGRVPRC